MQPPLNPQPPSSDLRALLIVMGILFCLVAVSCGGGGFAYMVMLPAILEMSDAADPEMAEFTEQMEGMSSFYILSGVIYLVLGIGLLWLGIGLIRCRRWAWKLSLASGWLIIGLILTTCVSYLPMIPAFINLINGSIAPPAPGGPPPSPAMGSWLTVLVIVISLGFYITPGVIMIIVFGLKNVRFTCEYRDPVPRWTDRVPVPVLVLWLLLVMAIPGICIAVPFWSGMTPMKIEGMNPLLAIGTCAVAVLLCSGAVALIPKMKVSGLIAALIAFLILGAGSSFAMTGWKLSAMYEGLGMDDEIMELYRTMDQFPFWQVTAIFSIILVLYSLFLLRYFKADRAISTGPQDPSNPYTPPGQN